MSRPFTPKVVTANDLLIGDVIYQTVDDGWTRDLAKAEILTDEADAQLRLLHAERQHTRLVGAYLADVNEGPDGPLPAHFREAFRASGPSNHNHGKQERTSHV
ncbi:DUF2849 domain-containing protein [Pontibaca salina]|uniref:DUF2849 domain-containing protein n=1 Tax=Pontibaca salina TaxID=2795731 RepID=A0A934M0Q8_9RHOB|nr:DUF2849 domain-containing protein [Pontibaca salina]MBI6628901.1 DUF2849 domain-containing protein [Pontibaca salina]